jgi:ribose/xylose/arabinose/galactoside ABC-type transport system permease subunit
MSDTIKKLLLCTSGMVLSVAFAALGAWLYCHPWPCEGAKDVSCTLPTVTAVILGGISLLGYIALAIKWAGWKIPD